VRWNKNFITYSSSYNDHATEISRRYAGFDYTDLCIGGVIEMLV